MNDRIKYLAIQAGLITYPTDGKMDQVQQFAKLILQETLEQVDKLTDSLDNDGDDVEAIGAVWAGLAIARHFGLE